MLFNSIDFLIFYPIVFLLYWIFFKNNIAKRNLFLLIASYIFYGWWDWRFLFLIALSSTTDFIIGQLIYKTDKQSKKKMYLSISLIISLGILFMFKYFNFFIDSFIETFTLFGKQINYHGLRLILPVGISFYTFQTLSYSIDIYKNKLKPTTNIVKFFTFVSFFPQLVAGPIERATHLLPQFDKKYEFKYEQIVSGFELILIGMVKKVVIADRLATYVDAVYNNYEFHNGITLYLATIIFAVQIYCDFSGYSDIAIGVARSFGFDLMKNFRTPYFATSMKDFWRRWHISLSTWFKDYFYITIGGNRCSKLRQNFNLLATFVVSGLWHGANWTYVIWGGIHGLTQIVENSLNLNKNKKYSYIEKLFRIIIVFHIVSFAWIFFRSNSLTQAIEVVTRIFKFEIIKPYLGDNNIIFYGFIALIIYIVNDYCEYKDIKIFELKKYRKYIYVSLIIIILSIGVFDAGQFIYFQF